MGFEDDAENVLLLMDEAFGAVEEHLKRQNRSIGLTNKTLIRDLRAAGFIEPAGQKDHGDGRPRVWRMRRDLLGLRGAGEGRADHLRVLARQVFRSCDSQGRVP